MNLDYCNNSARGNSRSKDKHKKSAATLKYIMDLKNNGKRSFGPKSGPQSFRPKYKHFYF